MMSKKLLFIFLFFLISCKSNTNEKGRYISIFNNISFELISGETVVALDQNVKNRFLTYTAAYNIPLFRCVEADSYHIYMGIPYGHQLQHFETYKWKNKPDLLPESTTIGKHAVYHLFKPDNRYAAYTSLYCMEKDENLIFVLTECNSKTIQDIFFNQERLSKRILIQ